MFMQSLRRLRVAPLFLLCPPPSAPHLITSQNALPLPFISSRLIISSVSMEPTDPTPLTLLAAYERQLGAPNRKSQEPPSPLTLSVVLDEAARRKRPNIIRAVATDFLRSEEQPPHVALQFVEIAAKDGVLSNSQVVEIYKTLCDEDGRPTVEIPVRCFARVAMAVLSKAPHEPELMDQIARSIDEDEVDRHPGYPEVLVRFLFAMILKEDVSRTAMLLDKLRGTVVLSFGSIERVQHVQDRKTLFLCILLHPCAARQWWSLGISICRALFHSPPKEAKTATDCIQTFLKSGLKRPTPTRLQAYADLIIAADESGLPAFDPATLQSFYSACIDAWPPDLKLATKVYLALRKECSQAPSISSTEQLSAHYRCLPPTGQPMLAMMKFFFETGDQRTAHMLAVDTEPLLHTLPYHSLPEYLLLLTKHSFHRQARTAYERCAASSDPLIRGIVAHSGVVKRLVSMSMHRAARARAKVENAKDETGNHAANALDYYRFARLMATNFAKSCLPLYSADYQKLTALGHILLLVGDYEAAIVAMEARLTISADQPPDLLDISVLLNSIGQYDPHFVIETIKNMLERGLEPDSGLYGQVIQICLKHDLPHLADEILQLGQSRHPDLLQPRTLGAILWHSVSHLDHLISDEKIARLESIYKLLTNFSPQQGGIVIKPPAATTLNIAREAFKKAVELDAPLATKYHETFLKGTIIRASDSSKSPARRSGKEYADWQTGMLGRAWKGHREGWLENGRSPHKPPIAPERVEPGTHERSEEHDRSKA